MFYVDSHIGYLFFLDVPSFYRPLSNSIKQFSMVANILIYFAL